MKAEILAVMILVSSFAFPSAAKFPVGQGSPEGVACDLARAFIAKDGKLFRRIVIPPYGGADLNKRYRALINSIVTGMAGEAKRKTPSPMGPKAIVECYASRHLSRNGPASTGYALFDFKDIEFVDVKVRLVNGRVVVNRTLVIRDSNGKWYVHPAPDMSPMLSEGLNDQAPSTVKFNAKQDPALSSILPRGSTFRVTI